MEEYERLVSEGKTGELSELPESELDNYSGQIEDKHFDKFKKRIEADPDQVNLLNKLLNILKLLVIFWWRCRFYATIGKVTLYGCLRLFRRAFQRVISVEDLGSLNFR